LREDISTIAQLRAGEREWMEDERCEEIGMEKHTQFGIILWE
jgi:hypothetical protein